MSYSRHSEVTALGAGIRLLWAQLEVQQGRQISAAQLAREASVASGGVVQAGTPWALCLGRDYRPDEASRLLKMFDATVEDAERIGDGDVGWLAEVMGEGTVSG